MGKKEIKYKTIFKIANFFKTMDIPFVYGERFHKINNNKEVETSIKSLRLYKNNNIVVVDFDSKSYENGNQGIRIHSSNREFYHDFLILLNTIQNEEHAIEMVIEYVSIDLFTYY